MQPESRELVSLNLKMMQSSVPGEWVVDIGDNETQENLFHFFVSANSKEEALLELKSRLIRD